MLLLKMISNKNRLFYEIIIELLAIEADPIDNELQKYRRKLYYDIEQRMRQHAQDIKSCSQKQKQEHLYNTRELELRNKEREKAEQVRLDKVMNYISNRDNYDKHFDVIIEKLRHVNIEINKLNDYHTKRSQPYTAAVFHAVQQAVKQDKIHSHACNQKQYKKKFLIDELERMCKLEQMCKIEQEHIMRTHLAYQQAAYQQAANNHAAYQQAANPHTAYQQAPNPYTTYQQAVYQYKVYTQIAYQEPIYSQATHQEQIYSQAAHQEPIYSQAAHQEPIYSQATHQVKKQEINQELKLDLDQDLDLELELEFKFKQEVKQDLNLDKENTDIWLSMVD
jgi:hypothetical protein